MRTIIATACCMSLFSAPAPGQIDNRREPPKTGDLTGNRQVKVRTIFGEGTHDHSGEVIKIDEKEMQVMVVPPPDVEIPAGKRG